ncbi:hypothetical protein [Sphingobium phenoxybenzoativorans]|uniref:hypothetical protein n=1 Tax=Sphingobium phenoxybenzoativorans TaxID=1592790 RepID=UPI000872DF07|nr:hypothetical protein [Sphingobium phenoxybenzoativorans]
MTDAPRRARRKRTVDRLALDEGDIKPVFDPDAWADDILDMLQSTRRYYSKPQNNDARDRAAAVLGVVVKSFMQHPLLKRGKGIEDLETLRHALKGLRLGRVHPLIASDDGVGSGAPATSAEREFKLYVLAAAVILKESSVPKPYQYVAELLYREGYRGKKSRTNFPASTVANWRSETDDQELTGHYMRFRSNPEFWGEATWPLSQARAKALAHEIISHPWMKLLNPPS